MTYREVDAHMSRLTSPVQGLKRNLTRKLRLMTTSSSYDPLLLPPGSRLLYVGPPKTGTTALQHAAARARNELRKHGVCYPGRSVDHRRPIYALLGRPDDANRSVRPGATRAQGRQIPARAEWDELLGEANSDPDQRVLISHEGAAGATDEAAIKFVQELGHGRTHVVITLRSPASILASRWVELLKNGRSETLDAWLKRVYGKTDRPVPDEMRRSLDAGALVERWARAAGPQNVIVIVVDKSDRDRLTSTFERLLGLPAATLVDAPGSGNLTNRSLTLAEAEVLRRVNRAVFNADETSWSVYLNVVRQGAVRRLLTQRTPTPAEARVSLPAWAADLAMADAKTWIQRITDSGVRVVGDLGSLAAPTPTPDAPEPSGNCDQTVAVELLAGAVLGASRLEASASGRGRTRRRQG